MTTTFEVIYDLAIELQCNPKFSPLTAHRSPLTANHHPDRLVVETRLRNSILQLVMAGEGVDSNWKKIRIFCRNYVNRAQPPIKEAQILALLTNVENLYHDDSARVEAISKISALTFTEGRAKEFVLAIKKITSPEPLDALGGMSYLDWVSQRWLYWVNQSVEHVTSDALLSDIYTLSANQETKIIGMGLPLASNYFADMGLVVFAKPDLHVTPVINMLQLTDGEENAFRGVVRIAGLEHNLLNSCSRFNWLRDVGGLQPRHLDRLIYLIGSDNFLLDGKKNKRHAPDRRKLIRDALIASDFVIAKYVF